MTWFGANKDLVGITIAALALIISLLTVMGQRQQQRRETFLVLNEMLTQPDVQEGRRLLFEAMRSGSIPPSSAAEFRLMNRALAAYDSAGAYARMRLVSRRWFLEMWHHSLRDIGPAARAFAEQRNSIHQHWYPWPDLWVLVDNAERFRSRLQCCRPKSKANQQIANSTPQSAPAPSGTTEVDANNGEGITAEP